MTKDSYGFFNDMHFSIFCLNNFFLVITKCLRVKDTLGICFLMIYIFGYFV